VELADKTKGRGMFGRGIKAGVPGFHSPADAVDFAAKLADCLRSCYGAPVSDPLGVAGQNHSVIRSPAFSKTGGTGLNHRGTEHTEKVAKTAISCSVSLCLRG
jgi:hypothetical protein